MDNQILSKIQELIQQGEKLVPEGGLEFSGYNAKMQSQYLTWRKNCLDSISKLGDKAIALRDKIAKDENGAYFYQTSAQNVLDAVKASLPIVEEEAKKNTPPPPPKPIPAPEQKKVEPPKPAPTPVPAPLPKTEAPKPEPQKVEPLKQEIPKPAPAPVQPQAKAQTPVVSSNKSVLVLSSSETDLQNQLIAMLKEIGVEGILFQRGEAIDAIVGFLNDHAESKFAFYLFTAKDINSAMFELGYLVGKVGSKRVCCIHHKDDAPPKGVPGITYKEIVVKLEEISFGLIKDLKAAGYTVSL